MELSIDTWRKNDFEVIDYDSNILKYSFFEIDSPGYIYRYKNEIINVNYKLEKEEHEKLFEILFDEDSNYELKFNNYDFDDTGNIKTKNSTWFALIKKKIDGDVDANRYELREGDIIKIGRIIFRLKLFNIQKGENKNNLINSTNSIGNLTQKNNNNITKVDIPAKTPTNTSSKIMNLKENQSLNIEANLKEIQVNSPIYKKKLKIKILNINKDINNVKLTEEKKEIFCRICYGEENEEENPLVQPCNCQGSMKYIHLKCLKHWLETNTYTLCINREFSKTFKFKESEAKCELCKANLPDFIRHKGKLYKIMDFGNYYQNYAILECLTLDSNNHKFLYLLSLDNNNKLLTIGRGRDCSLVVNDASISRNHCAFRFSNKKLILEDCGSKFGTSVLCFVEKIKLTDELKLYLQIGRSFIQCQVKKNSSLFDCCNVNEIYNFDFYYKQNKIKIEDFHKMTVKTEIDFENENEEEKNDKTIDFSETESLALKKNKSKMLNEEISFHNLDCLVSPLKLNAITECIDENNNNVNKSENEEEKKSNKNENENN